MEYQVIPNILCLLHSGPASPTLAGPYQGVVTPIDSVQTPATGVKNWVKQSKPKIWKVKRSKAHRKLEKVKGQAQ